MSRSQRHHRQSSTRLAGLFAAAACLSLAACGGDSGGASSHVSITECDVSGDEGDLGNVSAVVKIENKGSSPASYQALITFSSPDGSRQMGSGVARASGLFPGQSTSTRVHGEIFAGPQRYECEVAEVQRVD